MSILYTKEREMNMKTQETIIYPTPLDPTRSPPPFPIGALPQTIRDMVQFVAETTQVYPDMPAAVALAALSVCLQGKAKVYFSEHWAEDLNLYILICAPPGERKSAVFSSMTKPITNYVADYNQEHLIDVQTYRNTRKQLECKLHRAIEKDEPMDTVKEIQQEINTLPPVDEMKLITTDVTAEALAGIMSENDEVMGILSPEGGIFDVISGMYSNNVTNLNIFLSSYDGEPVKIDRKYGSVALHRPLLTFGICTQPQVLNSVINNPQFSGKGLTQRFLFCIPDSMIGHRKLIQDVNGSSVTRAYSDLITRLLNMPRSDDCRIDLGCKAVDLLTAFADKIEYQMSDTGNLAEHREFFSKILGKTLRIAGIIHLCEHPASECISGETMQAAIEIVTYFGQHYLKMMCADNYDNSAQYLLEKITARIMRDGRTVISLRDIKRTAKRLSSEQIETALEKLTACNYLEYIPPPEGSGNRRKESYELNPIILEPDVLKAYCPSLAQNILH